MWMLHRKLNFHAVSFSLLIGQARAAAICFQHQQLHRWVCRIRGTYEPINFAVFCAFSRTPAVAGVSPHPARNRLARIPPFFSCPVQWLECPPPGSKSSCADPPFFAHSRSGRTVPPPGPKSTCANSAVFVSNAAAPQPLRTPRSRPTAAPATAGPQPPRSLARLLRVLEL